MTLYGNAFLQLRNAAQSPPRDKSPCSEDATLTWLGARGPDFQIWDSPTHLARNLRPPGRRRTKGVPEGRHDSSPG